VRKHPQKIQSEGRPLIFFSFFFLFFFVFFKKEKEKRTKKKTMALFEPSPGDEDIPDNVFYADLEQGERNAAFLDFEFELLEARRVGTRLRKIRERLERTCARRNEFMKRHPQDFYIGKNWTTVLEGNRAIYDLILKGLDLQEPVAHRVRRLAASYTNAYAEPAPADFAGDFSRQKRIEAMKFDIATMAEMEQDADERLRHLDQGDAVQGGGGPMSKDEAEARELRWDCHARGSEMKTELCILDRGYHVPGDQVDCVHCDFEKEY
jgi:hypothetical protein